MSKHHAVDLRQFAPDVDWSQVWPDVDWRQFAPDVDWQRLEPPLCCPLEAATAAWLARVLSYLDQ